MEKKTTATHVQKDIARAMKELMRHDSFEHITVSDICRAADVGRRTFYRYFIDKYDLLNWILDYDFFSKLKYHEGWTVWDYTYLVCQTLYLDRKFYANAFIDGQNSSREHILGWFRENAKRDFSNTFKTPEEEDFWIAILHWRVFDMFVYWLKKDPELTPDEFYLMIQDSMARFFQRASVILSAPKAPGLKEDAEEILHSNFL